MPVDPKTQHIFMSELNGNNPDTENATQRRILCVWVKGEYPRHEGRDPVVTFFLSGW